MHSETPLLKIDQLTVDFRLNRQVISIVRDLSFTLEKGKTLGIAGESGSGKTVTLQSILRLIPTPPLYRLQGEIAFNGVNLLTASPKTLRRIRGKQIAYIFQEPTTALNPVLTIGRQITEMIQAHEHLSEKNATARALSLLEEVGIPDPTVRLNHYPHELSGGMRQRVMIAIALSCNPELLLADEPTTALDVTIQAQILELFKTIAEKRGMSVIFVTHDLSVLAEIADHILIMKDGAMVEYNDVFSIFDQPQSAYTKHLLNHIRQ